MTGIKNVDKIVKESGCEDYKWISGDDVVIENWVRFKCTFGCPSYGKNGTCPPNIPPVTECREFFREYKQIVVLHFQKKMDDADGRHEWSTGINTELLKLEREVFLAGYRKAFLLFMDSCHACGSCSTTRIDCNNLKDARPSPEAMSMDVFATVKKVGFPIEVLTDYSDTMDRYAFLLVE